MSFLVYFDLPPCCHCFRCVPFLCLPSMITCSSLICYTCVQLAPWQIVAYPHVSLSSLFLLWICQFSSAFITLPSCLNLWEPVRRLKTIGILSWPRFRWAFSYLSLISFSSHTIPMPSPDFGVSFTASSFTGFVFSLFYIFCKWAGRIKNELTDGMNSHLSNIIYHNLQKHLAFHCLGNSDKATALSKKERIKPFVTKVIEWFYIGGWWMKKCYPQKNKTRTKVNQHQKNVN